MSRLRQVLDGYLSLRRALGFKLNRAAHLLPEFIDHLEAAGAATVTTELALEWATQPPKDRTVWFVERLDIVRAFAEHLSAFDPDTEIPPKDLLPRKTIRAEPYLYTDDEIASMMAATRTQPFPLQTATYETLIGLMAVTGMRVGEIIGLDRDDMDLKSGLLTVRDTKFGKSRELPLHPSTVDALRRYAAIRDQLCPRPKASSFFVSTAGTRLIYQNVHFNFLSLAGRAGLRARSPKCRPRPHDLRHTFTVRTLIDWYRRDLDVEALMPLLSTYLGHVSPGGTYWYLQSVPELVTLAARKLNTPKGKPS